MRASPISGSKLKRHLIRVNLRAGFTILEVAVAGFVMITALCGTLYTLTHTFQQIDTARNSTLAAQIMQSEIESVRLKNFTDLSAIATAAKNWYSADLTKITSDTKIQERFANTKVTVNPDATRTDIVWITVDVIWSNYSGTESTRTFKTKYSKNGLHDYYYTIARP